VRAADSAGDVGRKHHRERPAEDDDQPVRRAERHGLPARPRQADNIECAGAEAEQEQHDVPKNSASIAPGNPARSRTAADVNFTCFPH
jgi:hypothetical protein